MLLLILAAACGSSPDPGGTRPSMPTEMSAPVPTEKATPGMAIPASASFDQMFVDMMVPHHEGAIEMAKIAQTRAERPEIKAMAEGILTSQQVEIQKMKDWRKAWFGSDLTPAMGMPMGHAKMPGMGEMPGMSGMSTMPDIEALKTATPFDLAFLDAMIPHHEGAVMMARVCAEKAQHDEVKTLAAEIIRAQEQEIAQMQGWRKAWYPAAPTLATAPP